MRTARPLKERDPRQMSAGPTFNGGPVCNKGSNTFIVCVFRIIRNDNGNASISYFSPTGLVETNTIFLRV